MTKDEINKFIDHQQKVSGRNYQNYQETGVSRYYRAYDNAEKMIELARQALNSVDDHMMVGVFRSELSQLGTKALDAIHSQDFEKYKEVVKSLAAVAKTYGLAFDRWG